tara:strand:+ start:115 stop:1260 length:1146 start_codon:yes stop_codon:yes gene_type:complete
MNIQKKKIFLIVNDKLFIVQHLMPIIERLKNKVKLYIICSNKNKIKLNINGVRFIHSPIKRDPSLYDIFSLFHLAIIKIFFNPDISLSFTPKAGFINSLTFIFPGETIHYFTGQRWINFRGIKLRFYKYIDKFIITFSKRIYCDSNSQAKFIAKSLKVERPKVIGKGSISGVNMKKFIIDTKILKDTINSNDLLSEDLKKILKNNRKKRTIFGFIGRLHKDKGIIELIKAFKMHLKDFPNSYLIFIGPNELDNTIFDELISLENCFYIDFNNRINTLLPLLSCLVLPSHREGFGSVIIEAAASKVPVICSDIIGPKDFIIHMHNGFLFKPKSIYELKNALDFACKNKTIFKSFSKIAYNICKKNFSEENVTMKFIKEIVRI